MSIYFGREGCKICGTKTGPHVEIKFRHTVTDICVNCAHDAAKALQNRINKFMKTADEFKNAFQPKTNPRFFTNRSGVG